MSPTGAQADAASEPELFGILHRHLAGDEALLRLAQAQLERARMGGELYPATVEDAHREWHYVPRGLPRHMLHLPRHLNVFSAADRALVVSFARALGGRVRGLVFHDCGDWPTHANALAAALVEVDRQLRTVPGQPMLFLEYAAGLELDAYAQVIERMAAMPQVGACIDTGHVLIFSALRSIATRHPEVEACQLDPQDPALAALARDLDQAGRRASDDLVVLVERVARVGKPMHFHLHDGHVLSRLSRYGVCDHLPFGERIPVTSALAGDGALRAMLGPLGLRRVLAAVRAHLSAPDVSLTLEIHPHRAMSRKPLGEWARWFCHWTELTNAELTHAWLDCVAEQAVLVRRLWGEVAAPVSA